MKYIIIAIITWGNVHVCISQTVRIHPNSFIGRLARNINHTDRYAVTIGGNIFISCPLDTFITNKNWVRHELAHVRQYKYFGLGGFLKRYLWFSLLHGYYNNPFELEASLHEDD